MCERVTLTPSASAGRSTSRAADGRQHEPADSATGAVHGGQPVRGESIGSRGAGGPAGG